MHAWQYVSCFYGLLPPADCRQLSVFCLPRRACHRGGHGRTGTLVAVMLGRLYDLPASTALRLTQAYHDTRVYPQGVRSPQTTVQRAQVSRTFQAAAVCQHSSGYVG